MVSFISLFFVLFITLILFLSDHLRYHLSIVLCRYINQYCYVIL